MANYTFETMSQADANAFTSGDTLTFSSTTLKPADVVVANSETEFNVTTLTAGGKSISFPGVALTNATIQFVSAFAAGSDATLALGSFVSDNFSASGTSSGTVVYGLGDDDFISISGGSKNVYGGEGNDTIFVTGGTAGHNIFGEGGNDVIDGGSAGDHLYGYGLTGALSEDGADVIKGFDGNDYIQGNAGDDSLDGGNGNDRILGGAGDDTILGGAHNDSVNGNKGDDVIFGDGGADSLRGGAGNDIIDGGTENDVILGDLGDDTITGGAGQDLVTGGAGKDLFDFSVAGHAAIDATDTTAIVVDLVTDFTHGDDTLDLGAGFSGVVTDIITPTGLVFLTLEAAYEYATVTADIGAGDILALQVGTATYLFYDDAGLGGTPDSAIGLLNVTAADLVAADFV